MTKRMPVRRALARWFWRFSRFRLIREQRPHAGARVMIGAPHSSNWDGVLMIAIAWDAGLHLRWLGKHQLFRGPLGPFMRGLGGISVDRDNPSRVVTDVVAELRRNSETALVVTPEGTRGEATYWRSGFYRIASEAGLPVTLGFVDTTTMTTGLGPTIELTGNVSADMDVLRAFYADKVGVRGRGTVPRLRSEDAPADLSGPDQPA